MGAKTSLPIGITDLLDAGLHFGHQSKRWNPKMKRFVFGKRNGIYIIDLVKTQELLAKAQDFIYETVASGRKVLFVGTKKACHGILKEMAASVGQHYVSSRWLGGTLTNNRHIASSIQRMREIEALEKENKFDEMPQKEASRLRHELARLQRNLSGIAEMQEMPGALIIVDLNREAIAVQEARRMRIPVVALVDTNCDPDLVGYPIPGNDDAIRGIKLVLGALVESIAKAGTEYEAAVARIREAREAQKKLKAAQAESQAQARRERKPRRGSSRTRNKKADAPEAAAAETSDAPAAEANTKNQSQS